MDDMAILDSGPIYRETIVGRFPVEPWNTWSNLVFLFVVLYWGWHVYRDMRGHWFLVSALPVLFIGFVGGTLFHGTRGHEAWLLMDWVPILVLCMACVVLFARRAAIPWPVLGALLLLPFLLRWLTFHVLNVQPAAGMNVGYAVMGLVVLLPIVQHMRVNHWHYWSWMTASALSFAVAVTFRSLDHSPYMAWMPMGTHWLWHTFGGIAVFFLVGYIWMDDRRRLRDGAISA
ncbi:MAG: hypothetical protein JNM31_12990 [Flavobacteriales bacterium]|nr:hypothetical protein [Flavobacteriales bacterium]